MDETIHSSEEDLKLQIDELQRENAFLRDRISELQIDLDRAGSKRMRGGDLNLSEAQGSIPDYGRQ